MENAPDEGYCGDGIVQISSGEECDDRNRVVTDGCVSKSGLSLICCELKFAAHIEHNMLRVLLLSLQSVNMLTVEMDIDMRALKSVMGRTLDTKLVTHTFQGKNHLHVI